MKIPIPLALLTAGLLTAPMVSAEDEAGGADIWKETKIITNYVLDTRLSPFAIEVAVRDDKAYLAAPCPSLKTRPWPSSWPCRWRVSRGRQRHPVR